MGQNWAIKAAADAIGLGGKQLRNAIGSGKVRVVLVQGQRLIPDEEVERVRQLRALDADFYVVWQRPIYLNSRYAAYLARLSQDGIADLFNRGELAGRKLGNVVEVALPSLEAWLSLNYRWGQPVRLPIALRVENGRVLAGQEALSHPSGAGQSHQYTRP